METRVRAQVRSSRSGGAWPRAQYVSLDQEGRTSCEQRARYYVSRRFSYDGSWFTRSLDCQRWNVEENVSQLWTLNATGRVSVRVEQSSTSYFCTSFSPIFLSVSGDGASNAREILSFFVAINNTIEQLLRNLRNFNSNSIKQINNLIK